MGTTLLIQAGCGPFPPGPRAPFDGTAVRPASGDWASEPSMVFMAARKLLVMSFNDPEGGSHYNWGGLAYSEDFGKSWKRSPPQLPMDGSGEVHALIADPLLATNGSAVLYAMMGQTAADVLRDPDVIIVSRSADGIHWPPTPSVVVKVDPENQHFIDKPSVSFVASTAVLAYSSQIGSINPPGQIRLTTSDDEGLHFGPDEAITGVESTANQPIIKLTTNTTAYLSYVVKKSSKYDIRVMFLSRETGGDGSNHWTGSVLFRRDDIPYDPLVTGANPSLDTTGRGESWRDAYPVSFDVGSIDFVTGAAHLYLAYRKLDQGRNSIYLTDCLDDAQHQRCAGVPDPRGNWQSRVLTATLPGLPPSRTPDGLQPGLPFTPAADGFQPVVAAEFLGTAVAVSWYQWDSQATKRLTMVGRYSKDGRTFVPAISLNPRSWWACPLGLFRYYGDYLASVLLPRTPQDSEPYVVTAYTESSGTCSTSHAAQQVQVSVW